MNLPSRVLFVAWQNRSSRQIHPVGRLIQAEDGSGWEFAYLKGAQAAGFSHFPSLPVLDEVYRGNRSELPPFLQNRLMPKSRPDRAEFIEHLGLTSEVENGIPILVRSEGVKETDTIEVFGLPTFDEKQRCYRYFFFVRGIRHVEGAQRQIEKLSPGDDLHLRPENDNEKDQFATLVNAKNGEQLGWAPRNLTADLRELIEHGGIRRISVERINPSTAPIHLRLLCRLEAAEREGFTPFSSDLYQPISADAMQLDVRPSLLVDLA